MPTLSGSQPRPPAHLFVEKLSAGYGSVPVVSDVALTVGRGEVVSMIGPNGAGKSTLVKSLVGVVPLMNGNVRLGETDISKARGDRLARMGVGYVPQTNDVFNTLTVAENLEIGGYLLAGASLRDRVNEVLRAFPALAAMRDRTASKLSGGERKMLAFGRALMVQPSVLLLDEPTSNLTRELAELLLRDHVRRIADGGAAVLLVEQRAIEALGISDWAYVLVAGSVRLSAPAREILSREDLGEVFLGATIDESRGGDGEEMVPSS